MVLYDVECNTETNHIFNARTVVYRINSRVLRNTYLSIERDSIEIATAVLTVSAKQREMCEEPCPSFLTYGQKVWYDSIILQY